MEHFGWSAPTVDGVTIFIRSIPLAGVLAKIQRPEILPYIPKLVPLLRSYRVSRVVVEPTQATDPKLFHEYMNRLSKFIPIHHEPFLPTKTILVDLTPSEKEIFKKFTEAKQRAVRRAEKHGIIMKQSKNIQDLVKIKNKSAGLFGEMTTYGLDKLWDAFAPDNAAILLAVHEEKTVGGVLLLFYDQTAYYWIAGATHEGKKLFAPTLLVWEALIDSKKRGYKNFDFVGVFDERFPKRLTSWKGFTKFKEGFGGTNIYYP